jgi:GPI mannosyltransferase 2
MIENIKDISRIFISFKLITIGVCFIASYFDPYNNSTALLFKEGSNLSTRLLGSFLRWDAVYFVMIAENGYSHEKMHAFYPLFPWLISQFSKLFFFSDKIVNIALAGITLSITSQLIATIALYSLTLKLFGNDRNFAFMTCFFFMIQPASYHMTCPFAEGLFAALSISGMFALYSSQDNLAALLFFLSSLTRSNGALLSGFFLYKLIFFRKQKRDFFPALMRTLVSISGSLLYLRHCYTKYCPQRGEWCNWLIPNIYSFVQSSYWNVGAFKYYTTSQIPNFILSLPMLSLSFYGIYNKVKQDPSGFLFLRSKSPTAPFYYLWLFLLIFSLIFVHIQVVNRIFSFLPPVFWTISELYSKSSQRRKNLILATLGLYFMPISFQIACFYPPA